MRIVRLLCLAAAVGSFTCNRDDHETADVPALVRLSPHTVSTDDGWLLFDRSVRAGHTPGQMVHVTLGRRFALAVVKVFGPSPYRVRVNSVDAALDLAPIELSTIDGWHALVLPAPATVGSVDLQFEPLGGPGIVPEIELWAIADAPISALDIEQPRQGYVATKYANPVEIEAGKCGSFAVELATRPDQLRRAHLVYRAVGIVRGFELARAVNQGPAHGGAWIGGSLSEHTVVEEIDPSSLRMGPNEVTLCVPEVAAHGVAVEALRLIGELDHGNRLATRITNTAGAPIPALEDADLSSSVDLAGGTRIQLGFDRLTSPDVIALTGSASGVVVECVARDGTSSLLDVASRATPSGITLIPDRARACASLALAFPQRAEVSDINVLGSGASERVDWPRVIVSSAAEHFGDVAWLGGFVVRPAVMTTAIRVGIDGQNAESLSGDFGRLLRRSNTPGLPWRVAIKAAFPDGSVEDRDVLLDVDRRVDRPVRGVRGSSTTLASPVTATASKALPASPYGVVGETAVVRATQLAPTEVRLGTNVGLDIPTGALARPTDITVKHLDDVELPPLDPGMINVTAPRGHGYEFLPHGQTFAKPIEVVLPFSPALIPDGMTADDIHAFFYDPKKEKWIKLERRALDLGRHVTRSSTTHFTVMVNAVLATPKNPTPLSFDPSALASVAAASPATNIDLIEPPQTSSSGDARLALPIRLPAGRGAHSPSLTIGYSSTGGNGWLGVGWDLGVSRIEIDTRFGAATYSADASGKYPEHRYLFDGSALVPTLETDGPTCAGDAPGRRYRARVEGAFSHILRCGNDPASYRFEVHDRDGTRYTYGGDGAVLASSAAPNGIFKFQLREVVDTYGNTTRYRYDLVEASSVGEPGRDLYLSRIEYTSHPSLAAAYSVDLVRDDGARRDRLVSGRGGFKMETRHLLRAIHVKFQGSTIRSYALTYVRGQFEKSLLRSVRVYGTSGCAPGGDAFVLPDCDPEGLFHEHVLGYFEEAQGFEDTVAYDVAGDLSPTKPALGKGESTSISGSVTLSAFDVASATVGASTGERSELLGMYDVDSDGLVDQIYRRDVGETFVLFNQSRSGLDPSRPLFSLIGPTVSGLAGLGYERHQGWNVGLNLGASGGPSISAGFSNTRVSANQFLGDINGDGFVDVIRADGHSLLGQPCATGICFAPTSFTATTAIDPTLDPVLGQIRDELAERLFIGDPVVRWVAPYSGGIILSGTATKVRAGGIDGVTVELYRGNTLLSAVPIAADHVAPVALPTPTPLQVVEGEAFYIRVKTGANEGIDRDGALRDLVDARLTALYVRVCDGADCTPITDRRNDPTGRSLVLFDSRDDLRIAGAPAPLVTTAKGTLRFQGVLATAALPADVRACIQRFQATNNAFADIDVPCDDRSRPEVANVSGTHTISAASPTPRSIDISFDVEPAQTIMLRVESDLAFDPRDLTVEPLSPGAPLIGFTSVCLPNPAGTYDCSADPAVIEDVPLSTTHFGPFIALIDSKFTPFSAFLVEGDQSIRIAPPAIPNEPFLYAIRSDRQGLIHQEDCRVRSCFELQAVSFGAVSGESITIELLTESGHAPLPNVEIRHGTSMTMHAAVVRSFIRPPVATSPFVGGFHGWSASLWNEREAFEPNAILADYAFGALLGDERKQEIARTVIVPRPVFVGNALTENKPAWSGPGSSAFVRSDGLHAAILGAIHEGAARPGEGGGVFEGDFARLSGTTAYYLGVSSGPSAIAVFGLDASLTGSQTTTTTDVIDMNGDGVSDVISGGGVVLGELGGPGRVAPALGIPLGFRKRKGVDYAIGLDAVTPKTTSGGRTLTEAPVQEPDIGIGATVSVGLGVGRTRAHEDLVDINGDGLPDRISRDGSTLFVQYNLGDRYAAREPFSEIDAAMDADIDKLAGYEKGNSNSIFEIDTHADAIQHDTTVTQRRTVKIDFFLGSVSRSSSLNSSRTTRQLVDLNGDGLPDLLYKRSDTPGIKVQFNLGGRFGAVQSWSTPSWTSGGEPIDLASGFESRLDTLGVGGPDVLAGTGTQESVSYSASATVPGIGGGSATLTEQTDSYELALIDIDGDGAPDHVLRRAVENRPAKVFVKRNRVTGKANLLREIRRPLGGKVSLEYAQVGNTQDMPQRRTVLSRVTVDDGVDLGASFASPHVVMDYSYENGFWHRGEKEFFGFAKIKSKRADGVTIEAEFNNTTYALRGQLLRETRRDSNGRLFHEQRVTRAVTPVLGDDDQPVAATAECLGSLHPLLTSEACQPTFPVVAREEEIRAEGGSTSKSRVVTEALRDRFGNVLGSQDDGDDAIASDDVHATVTYQNDTSRWILGRPTSIVLRAGSATGVVLRSRSGTYNAQGDATSMSVETGNGIATTQLAYDGFGNLQTATTPPNHAHQVQTVTVDYDPETRTHATATTNGFGYTSSATYDLRFGVAISETDLNGTTLHRTLDAFGRLTSARGPYDLAQPALSFEYLPNASPPRAISISRSAAPTDYVGPIPAPITTVTIVDGLGQAIELRKTAVVDGVPGMTTSGLVSRDSIGRITRSYHPFFTAGASTGFISPVVTPSTTVAFDSLDRPVSTQLPDGAVESVAFDLATAPAGSSLLFRTRRTDANGKLRETYSDHLERARAFVEYPTPTTPSINRYDYLPTGELSRIVDAEQNQSTLGYDLRGLRTSLDNPDTGLIEERFDLMGNRIALVEPNHRAHGTQVGFQYERNRLVKIDYPSKTDVTFVYGAAGAPSFRAGRLAEIQDESGKQEHHYGALGETRRTTRTVVDPANLSHDPIIFDTRQTYDSLGRLLRIGYPDGEAVTNLYDAGGMLLEVRGAGATYTRTYVNDLRYDTFGNRTHARFGNGVVSTWTFDPLRLRLATAVTTLPTSAKVQNLHYSYDPGSNPTRIQNLLPPPPPNNKLPGGTDVTYSYDGVDRLLGAVGSGQLGGGRTTYDQRFAFSASHNLIKKTRTHQVNNTSPPASNFASAYLYAEARPHLPTRIGDLDITYDPSGNPTRRVKSNTQSVQTFTWDDDGRMAEANLASTKQRNVYDASGLRVIRTSQQGVTVFASPLFDLENNNTGSKHIFAGSQRVATVLGTFTSTAMPVPPTGAGSPFFFHGNHLGSTSVVTGLDGDVNDAHEYFPDGEAWIDSGPKKPINGYLFNGKTLDPDTGFYDYGQRYYDPRLSVWLGVDPASTAHGVGGVGPSAPNRMSPVGFNAHNPISNIDPDGADWVRQNSNGGDPAGKRWIDNTRAAIRFEVSRVARGRYLPAGWSMNAPWLPGTPIGPGPEADDILAMSSRHVNLMDQSVKSANWILVAGAGVGVGGFSTAAGVLGLGGKTEGEALFGALPSALSPAVSSAKATSGSGPAPGVIEVSGLYASAKAFQNYTPRYRGAKGGKSIEFVYDFVQSRFVVGQVKHPRGFGSPHQQLAATINAKPTDVVGGMFQRHGNGIFTNEFSGHFYGNWTPAIREQFVKFMKTMTNQPVTHTPGM